MSDSKSTDDTQIVIDEIAEILARSVGQTKPTPKILEMAESVTRRLTLLREPGPHDVIAVFVDQRQPKESEPEFWIRSFLEGVQNVFPGARICVLPIQMDIQRVPPAALPSFRDKIAALLNTIELHIAAAEKPPIDPSGE